MKKLLIILFISSVQAQAQTAFYFDTSSPTDVTPATTGWESTASALIARNLTTTTKLRTSIASTTIAVANALATDETLFYRGVSASLKAQTISGTVTGYFRMNLSSITGCTAQSRIKITVVNRAGTAVATLLATTAGAANIGATLTSVQVANAAALSSYACADGDRIVIEIGIGRSVGTTARNGVISFGSSSATDISAAGSATANNPVVTFSGNINFYKGIAL